MQQNHPQHSLADLIILAGHTAVEYAYGIFIPFCGGRVDADPSNSPSGDFLHPRHYEPPEVLLRDFSQVNGLTENELVTVIARGQLSTSYFIDLLAASSTSSRYEFTLQEQALMDEYRPVLEDMVRDEDLLKSTFAGMFYKLMTGDRFKSNVENICTDVDCVTVDRFQQFAQRFGLGRCKRQERARWRWRPTDDEIAV